MGLIYEKAGHIAKLGLNRPEQKNALDPGILLELHNAYKDIMQMPHKGRRNIFRSAGHILFRHGP
jgi:enoyl-CoA hydratase/carnithine racemase